MQPPICSYEGSRYQAEFWEHGGREYEDRVEAIALRRLLPPGGGLLLDVGAGAGRNAPRYAGFERVVLLDFSLSQLEQAQARLGRDERYLYVAADVYRLPFAPGLFDAAAMVRVLHHMTDAPAALQQVRQVLRHAASDRPGGAFVLEFANKRHLKAILRWWMRQQSWNPFTPEPIEFARLNFDFHPHTIRRWLAESDFHVRRQLSVSHYRVAWLKRHLPVGLLVWLDSWAQLTGNWWQFSPSVFVRADAIGAGPTAGLGEFFRCPACGGLDLKQGGDRLTCGACGKRWAFRDGIYDFREPL